MRIVDTKGLLCPAPLIATKRALKETAAGDSFVVLTDNYNSFINVSRFLKDNKTGFQVREKDGVWSLTITAISGDLLKPNAEEYCETQIAHFEQGKFIVVIGSDRMGEGDEELGHLLIINFIKALKDLDKLPRKLVFYNSGVKLVIKSSPVIEHLRDLEKMGVELLLCSTCVSYYKLEDQTGAGIISNMYVIAEAMASAGNIIKP